MTEKSESEKCCRDRLWEGSSAELAILRLQIVATRLVKRGDGWIGEGVIREHRGPHYQCIPFDEGLYWEAKAALELVEQLRGEREASAQTAKQIAQATTWRIARGATETARKAAWESQKAEVARREAWKAHWAMIAPKEGDVSLEAVDTSTYERERAARVAWEVVAEAKKRMVGLKKAEEVVVRMCRDEIESRRIAMRVACEKTDAAQENVVTAEVEWQEAERLAKCKVCQ